MKKLILFSFLFFGIINNYSCSNPNYVINPNSLGNNSVNPIGGKPNFTWSGTSPISAQINGVQWVADASSVTWSYSHNYNIFGGNSGGKFAMAFWVNGVYAGNTVQIGGGNYMNCIEFSDGTSTEQRFQYYSYEAPSKTGWLQVIRNDTFLAGVPGYIEGKFMFEGQDSTHRIVNVTNGYFNIQKW